MLKQKEAGMKPISVQLYSLREPAAKDFVAVLKRVAEIGYTGVEPAGFHNLTPKEFRQIVEDLGMVISSSHGPGYTPEKVNDLVDTMHILGLDTVSAGFGRHEFKSVDDIKRLADKVNAMCATLKPHGLQVFMHNHWWEFEEVEGKLAYDIFAPLAPEVLFELDTYWASNFGANDVAEQVAKFKARTPYLHIKDGSLVKDQPHVAVGKGKMNFAKVIAAADPKVLRWLIVELDSCATDMIQAVADSYQYLVSNKLAEGRR